MVDKLKELEDRIEDLEKILKPIDQFDFNGQEQHKCKVCQMNLVGVINYVCTNTNCPSRIMYG